MPNEKPSPLILDAVKASASKFKENKSALEARARELDALKAQLDAEREDLTKQSAKLQVDRAAFSKEKEDVAESRASIDKDISATKADRDKVAAEEKRVQDWARSLNEREKVIKESEDRIKRLDVELTGQIKDSESKLQAPVEREELMAQRERSLADMIDRFSSMEKGLAERERSLAKREEDLIRSQNDRLSALEARERETLKIAEDMHSRQKESVAQHDSFVELQNSLKGELTGLASEREKLAQKEKSLIEAEKYLAAALEASGIDVNVEPPARVPPPPPPAAPPVAPPPVPAPAPRAEAQKDELMEDLPPAEAKPRISRTEALDRMTKALETAKKARDSGRNVSEIRKTLKHARAAFEAGDYDTAAKLAEEILRDLEAAPLPQ